MSLRNELEAGFEQHSASLYRTSRREGLDHQDAEDLVMDTMVRALNQETINSPLPYWLYSTRKNRYIDLHTDKNWRNRYTLTGLDELAETLPSSMSVESQVEQNLEVEEGLRILGKLTDDQKQVVLLVAEGYEYREIAEMTGASERTLRTRHSRAIQSLRNHTNGISTEEIS